MIPSEDLVEKLRHGATSLGVAANDPEFGPLFDYATLCREAADALDRRCAGEVTLRVTRLEASPDDARMVKVTLEAGVWADAATLEITTRTPAAYPIGAAFRITMEQVEWEDG